MNCDPIARWYRWLEYFSFGKALERRRFAFLDDVAGARKILALGDGDGRFLARLAEGHRGASILYLDSSARMLELARTRAGGEIRYVQADAREWEFAEGEYDLIVTHFFLDCFNAPDLEKLVERIAKSAQPNGLWLISEFRQPAAWATGLIGMLYLFFRLTAGLETRRLSDHHPLLMRQGFRLVKEQRARAGLLASELWQKDGCITSDNRKI